MVQNDPLIGHLLAGRFRVKDMMGEGAIGRVYRAEHEVLGREYAIKLLKPKFGTDSQIVERFRREARATSRLEHPNIVYCADFGQTEDGRFYLVMEYIPGESLRNAIAGARPLPLELSRAVEILRQIALALGSAHDANVIHRDLKPDNILLGKGPAGDDMVKILDFGLAKLVDEVDVHNLTRRGTVFGTPFYLSPEQAMGEPADNRSDIYSYGIIAYELVTGQVPFLREELRQVLMAHVGSPPPPIPDTRPAEAGACPAELEGLIMRLLEKQPDDRPSTMAEIIDVLEECQKGGLRKTSSHVIPTEALPDEDKLVAEWAMAESINPAPEEEDTRMQDVQQMLGKVGAGRRPPPHDPQSRKRQQLLTAMPKDLLWATLAKKAEDLARSLQRRKLASDTLLGALRALQQVNDEVLDLETDLALLRAEAEESARGRREREASLRHAVVDLRMDRSHRAEVNAPPTILKDLDYQIGELESSLHGLYADAEDEQRKITARVAARENKLAAAMARRRQREVELLKVLSGKRTQTQQQTMVRAFGELDTLLKQYAADRKRR